MFGLFKKKEPEPENGPFMEHPTGDFDSAIAAMEDAIKRLRHLPKWDRWIAFSAQGQGNGEDSYEFAEVKLLGNKLDAGEKPLDVPSVVQNAGVGATALVADGAQYSIAGASPQEVAQLLDTIFRDHFGLRPFDDEGDDYAVGAEWEE